MPCTFLRIDDLIADEDSKALPAMACVADEPHDEYFPQAFIFMNVLLETSWPARFAGALSSHCAPPARCGGGSRRRCERALRYEPRASFRSGSASSARPSRLDSGSW